MFVLKLLTGALVLGFLVYAGIEARGLFLGPQIILATPEEGAFYEQPLIQLKGQVLRAKSVTANGNKVLIDLEGNFQDYLVLSPGYNIISIVATDARGKSKTLTRHIYFKTDLPTRVLKKDTSEVATTTATTSDDTLLETAH